MILYFTEKLIMAIRINDLTLFLHIHVSVFILGPKMNAKFVKMYHFNDYLN